MLASMWTKRNFHSLFVGMENGTATLEGGLAVSYKIKHTLTIQSSNCTLWYLPKQAENVYLHKNLHTNDYSTLFIIAKTGMQPRCPSISEWTNCGTSRQRHIT